MVWCAYYLPCLDKLEHATTKKNKQVWTRTDPGEEGDLTPKTYESNFIHHNHKFVQIQKNKQSRYKAILSSIVLSQQFCEVGL